MVEDRISRIFIWFGDGSYARFVGAEKKIKEGIRGYLMELEPSEDMIRRFDLRRGDQEDISPNTGTILRWYPESIAWQLNPNPAEGIWLVLTSLDGDRSPLSGKYIELTEQIDDLQRECDIIKSEKDKLFEENELLTSQYSEKLKRDTAMIKNLREATGRMADEEDKKKK